jgi:hypothetical protein
MSPEQLAHWERQRKLDILKNQRARRKTYRRIDYYPSDEAADAIDALVDDGCVYSEIIDFLILEGAARLVEKP